MNRAIGIMEAFSNVNIVAKLQEVESSCTGALTCDLGGVVMEMKTRLESTKTVASRITSE